MNSDVYMQQKNNNHIVSKYNLYTTKEKNTIALTKSNLIHYLPTSTSMIHKDHNNNNNKQEEKNTCIVCQEEYVEHAEIITLPCLHYFHKECILIWLTNKDNCPVCRISILEYFKKP